MSISEALSYFDGDELAADVFINKYALRNEKGELLEKTPEQMHRRIAKEFARIEAKKFKHPMTEDEIFSYLDHFKFISPQGGPLTAIGNPYKLMSISNCFVLEPPLDSYGGIHRTDEQLSQISKRRGGCGIDISHLRPEGSLTANSSKTSSGIVPFLERYSNSIREVGQGGRRGALMITISVHHPQVLDFARVKLDLKKVTGANISIRLTDEFLNAVKEEKEYEQRWPVEGTPKISKMVNSLEVWTEIIKCAHKMAEPGLLFWDNIIRESPADCYGDLGFKTVATNPCSELPLCILDSCRLLIENLFSFVENPFTSEARFNFSKFYQYTKIAQRLMDNLVDLEIEQIDKIIQKINDDPEPDYIKATELELWVKIREKCVNGRRTGLGPTGLGDTIAALGLKYGSQESVDLTDKIYKTLKFGAYASSVEMAKELGPFPIWNHELEKDNLFLNRIKEENCPSNDHPDKRMVYPTPCSGEWLWEEMKKYGRRNISLLTSAPVGSLSIQTQTTSGIEPLFLPSYTRRKKINHNDKDSKIDFTDPSGDNWQEFTVYHPKLKAWMEITGETDWTKSPYFGSCAEDLDWKQRVKLQGAAQRHVDHAISSTINLPENVTVEQVSEIYEEAWRSGLKGITVYRKNCRTGVLVDNKSKKAIISQNHAPQRPKEVPCDVHHVSVKGKKYFVLVGLYGDDNQPYELFAGRGDLVHEDVKKGKIYKFRSNFYKAVLDDESELSPITLGCSEEEETITRLTSTSLRHGTPLEFLVEQLLKVSGEFTSFAKALSRSLKKYIRDGAKSGGKCPECQNELIFTNGCENCTCGYSKCS